MLAGHRTVAVKVMHNAKARIQTTIAREVTSLVAVQHHKNIVGFCGLFDVGPPDAPNSPITNQNYRSPNWAIVLQYCPGGDLCKMVRQQNPCSETRGAFLIHGLLLAIQHLVQHGIVHRDVKPSNVLLMADDTPVLCDFGIAAHVSNLTDMMMRCGSPGFVAPEILRGEEYDTKVDIFGTGATLYFILCGHPPFTGNDAN